MRNKNYYDGEAIWKLPAFGIAAFNVLEAAEFIAKLLCLEGRLDKSVPDEEEQYCLNNPILSSLLSDEIKEYKDAIISGIEKGTLRTLHTSRDIRDQVDEEKTYIDIDVLHDWFSQRGIEISGDFYAEYIDSICEVHSAAIEAIIIKEDKIKRKIRDDCISPDQDKIYMLERRILELESQAPKEDSEDNKNNNLKTRERDTLLKMIIGMAVDSYGYDPNASRSPIPKEISDILAQKGMPLDQDTVRKWLKEAAELWPRDTEKPKS